MSHTDIARWFAHDRFGLFIHFGLYSVAARHEWVMNYEEIQLAEYQRYADHFDPDLFDAKEIARAAKQAGARYAVLTTKHHEGFCLWNTELTEYNSVKAAGRDLVAEFVDAMRSEGIRVGFYYSLLDWSHPDYTIDRHHPRRNDADWREQNATKDFARYREYMYQQVRELLTGYGDVDYLFFDFTEPAEENGRPGKGAEDWDAETLLAMCRELQPNMVINDRLGIPADLVTPEQYQPAEPLVENGEPVLWEACQTMNGSWGYHRDNLDFKSPELLATMLASSVAMGGNLLLNVGPTGRGEIAPRDRETLNALGDWMRYHSPAITGAGPSSVAAPKNAVVTQRGNRVYIHLLAWPFGLLHVADVAGRVRFARLLHDGSEVRFSEIDPDQKAVTMTPAGTAPGTLTLHLPVQRPDVAIPVIELTLDEA